MLPLVHVLPDRAANGGAAVERAVLVSPRPGPQQPQLLKAGNMVPHVACHDGTRVLGAPVWEFDDQHRVCSRIQIMCQIFEGLAKEGLAEGDVPTPPLVPDLATSWEVSPDGLQHTFKLCPGVKCHDGAPFDAAAVRFNFERFRDKSSPNHYPKAASFVVAHTKWIKGMEVLDPTTVHITLTAPNYEWLRQGLQSYGQPLMVSPAAVEACGSEGIALHPIGTGPFRFVERQQGVRTVLERNPDYWGRKAKLDRVILRPSQDPATRVNALSCGPAGALAQPV